MISKIFDDLTFWQALQQVLQGLQKLHDRHRLSVVAERLLPMDYSRALYHFDWLVQRIEDNYLDSILFHAAGSHPLRKYLDVQITNLSPAAGFILACSNPEDSLWWLLEQLTIRPDADRCGVYNLLDEIERLIANNEQEKARISPRLARLISDLALVSELHRQLRLLPFGELLFVGIQNSEMRNRCENILKPCNVLRKAMEPNIDLARFGGNPEWAPVSYTQAAYSSHDRQNAQS